VPQFLVVGLGNPGKGYEGTLHNAGREVAIEYAKKCGLDFKERANALVANGDDAIVVLPNTFMNNSGIAVWPIMNRKAIPLEKLIVLVDDTYIEMGKIRIKPNGSCGGHNGLLSIEESLGNRDWARIRIGVGPDPGGTFRSDYVLSRPRPEVIPLFAQGKELARFALETILDKSLEEAMTIFNAR